VVGVADDVLLGSRSLNDCGVSLETMQVGDTLTFELVMGPKGYYANNIEVSHVGKRVIGTLKKIHGGNGFCSVEGVADDVLLGKRSLSDGGVNLEEMQLGDNITFEMAAGPKGYHAMNIQKDDVGKRVTGKLKRIHGGNGFCSVEGVAGDVLLGVRSLSDSGINLETMQLGDALSFEMARGPKGYHATNIEQEPELG
jgi:cold shock CspA family protein